MKVDKIVAYALSDNGDGIVIEVGSAYLGEEIRLPPLANGWIYSVAIEEVEEGCE